MITATAWPVLLNAEVSACRRSDENEGIAVDAGSVATAPDRRERARSVDDQATTGPIVESLS